MILQLIDFKTLLEILSEDVMFFFEGYFFKKKSKIKINFFANL